MNQVALSGEVFQNVTLRGRTVAFLREASSTGYTQWLIPPNDGGISLGQTVVAGAWLGA